MKNRGRNRLLMCFRPVATDEGPIKFKPSNGYGDPVTTCMAFGGGGKERTMISEILTSLPDEENSHRDVAGAGIDRKEKSRRRFSRALKAVLFDILLAKKIGSKKYRINSFRSNSNLSKKISKTSRELLDAEEDMLRTNSSRGSSSGVLFSYTTNGSGSLCSSRASSNSRSVSQRNGSFRTNSMELKNIPVPTKKVSRGFFSSNTGLSLLLLSLLVLIFWGKVCAILLCTSTWFFFMPGQSKGGERGRYAGC